MHIHLWVNTSKEWVLWPLLGNQSQKRKTLKKNWPCATSWLWQGDWVNIYNVLTTTLFQDSGNVWMECFNLLNYAISFYYHSPQVSFIRNFRICDYKFFVMPTCCFSELLYISALSYFMIELATFSKWPVLSSTFIHLRIFG